MSAHDRIEMMKALRIWRYFFKSRLTASAWPGSAMSMLMGGDLLASGAIPAGTPVAAPNPVAPKPPMFPGKAKSVIYLFMAGAPSHLDMHRLQAEASAV